MKKETLQAFTNPGAIYRGAPFWAWNNKLDADQLKRQIDCFKEMGLGGFHMHPRTGMDTEYLSEEFMSMIRACRDHAEKTDMLAWLYDEDRWPSGAAGGIVTRDERLRARRPNWQPAARPSPMPAAASLPHWNRSARCASPTSGAFPLPAASISSDRTETAGPSSSAIRTGKRGGSGPLL